MQVNCAWFAKRKGGKQVNINDEIKRLREENEKLRKILDDASQYLQDNGFEEKSKSIDCEAEI